MAGGFAPTPTLYSDPDGASGGFGIEPDFGESGEGQHCFGVGWEFEVGGPGYAVAGATVGAADAVGVHAYGWRGPAEVKFAGVVTGLVVDIHVCGEIGGLLFISPPWIGEPFAGLGDKEEIAAAGVIDADGGLLVAIEDGVDAGQAGEGVAGGGGGAGVASEDVGDLVIDPCAGGFTTAIACYRLGRRFVGCDIDADNVAAGRMRLAEEAGEQKRAPGDGRR